MKQENCCCQDLFLLITQVMHALTGLNSGKGNLIRSAEKVRELGVKPIKNIPTTLLDSPDS